MREACLILKSHLSDDVETLKSKEVVRHCIFLLPQYYISPLHYCKVPNSMFMSYLPQADYKMWNSLRCVKMFVMTKLY